MALSDISISHHATLQGHCSDVTCVDFSFNVLASCSSDKTVRLWDVTDPEQGIKEYDHSPLLGHRFTVYCCCFSPFGTLLATCSRDGYIILWEPKTGRIVDSLKHPSECGIRVCKFSPNSSYLATGSEDDTLAIWDLSTKSILRTYTGHDASVTACSFTLDNDFIVSGSTNGDLRLWDVKKYGSDLPLAYESEGHDLGVTGCEFSPCPVPSDPGSPCTTYLLATCGNDNVVRLFNVTVGINCSIALADMLRGHTTNINCCGFSSNGKLLASASGDKTVIVWNVDKRVISMKLIGHQRYVTSCSFSACNNYLASGSNDKTVMVWKLGSNPHFENPSTPKALTNVDAKISPPLCIATAQDDGLTPNEYFCPITQDVMRDPVIVADGFSYERSAITKWFTSGRTTSPMTNNVLPHTQLTPNYALKMLIQRHLQHQL